MFAAVSVSSHMPLARLRGILKGFLKISAQARYWRSTPGQTWPMFPTFPFSTHSMGSPLRSSGWKGMEKRRGYPECSSRFFIVLCVSEPKVVAGMCVGIKKTLRNFQKTQPRTPLGQSLTLFDLAFFRWNLEVTALLSGFPWRCGVSQRNPRSANTWVIFSYGSSSGGGQGRIDTKQHQQRIIEKPKRTRPEKKKRTRNTRRSQDDENMWRKCIF